MPFQVPNDIAVYFLLGDKAVTRERAFGWFQFQPSLQDGATKSAYPFFGVQGDHGLLRQPRRRTELYWALGNATWLGHLGSVRPQGSESLDQSYRDAADKFGHGPKPDGLFHDQDIVLAELDGDPTMRPFPNLNGREQWYCNENFCAGNAAASIGLDIRMYYDSGSVPSDGGKVGLRTVSAVRFGNHPGISVFPGGAMGVHGGAIQAVMDETTALAVRVWVAPDCTTRRITHQISKPVYQFQTYRVVCVVEGLQNSGALCTVKGTMTDVLGDVVCITKSDMVDIRAMRMLQAM